jgi:hypothetical protein
MEPFNLHLDIARRIPEETWKVAREIDMTPLDDAPGKRPWNALDDR